jgi:nucleoside-diphosphate-sugar epimerase
MKVLVTGATGRLGQVVCAELAAAGHEVVGTDWTQRPLPVPLVVANLLDMAAVRPLVAGMAAVVHLANYPHADYGPPYERIYAENIAMTGNVVLAAAQAGVAQLVYASSIQVLGGDRIGEAGLARPSVQPYLPLDHQTPRCPGNVYALSKAAGEDLLRWWAGQAPGRAAAAVRFPFLLYPAQLAERRAVTALPTSWGKTRFDECFPYLLYTDAARLVRCLLAAAVPGYQCYLPAAADPFIGIPLPVLVPALYPGVPLRRPLAELTSLVAADDRLAALGWTPPPLPR